jgi:phage terminase small subunit
MEGTGKQRAFVDEYLKDFNGVKAAKRAGYNGDYWTLAAIASENLKKPKIKEEIERRLAANAMDTDELLWRYGEKARFDASVYIIEDPKTKELSLDFDKLKANGKGHLIRKVYQTKYGTRIELADPDVAQQLIGKHLGLFVDRTENLNIDLSNLSNDQLKRIANGESPLDVLANPSTSGT